MVPTGPPRRLSGKESACQCRKCGFNPWVRKIPYRRKWQPTPVFLPGESHGQRKGVWNSLGRTRTGELFACPGIWQELPPTWGSCERGESWGSWMSPGSCWSVPQNTCFAWTKGTWANRMQCQRWWSTPLQNSWLPRSPGTTPIRAEWDEWSHVQLFVNPWTVPQQAPLSMEFSRQKSWSGMPFPSPGNLPTQGSNPGLLHCRQILYRLSPQGSSREVAARFQGQICEILLISCLGSGFPTR